jgi:hypothetical protein
MRNIIIVITIVLTLGTSLRAQEPAPIFDVPRVEGITIDGNGDDWGERGFCVDVLGDEAGKLEAASDLDAGFRLGWDQRGLLLLARVTGHVDDEAQGGDELWEKDSVEVFYAPHRGSLDVVQLVISPGVDPRQPQLRYNLVDERQSEALKKAKAKATATIVRTKIANGYILEVLLPWDNFGIQPETGRELAFQLYVNNVGSGDRFQALWYPLPGAHDSMRMHRIRLADKPTPAVRALVSAEYQRFRRVRIHVAATPELLGKTFTVQERGRDLASARFEPEDGRAGAGLTLAMPPQGMAYGALTALIDGQPLQSIALPDPEAARAKAFMDQHLDFSPAVFSGTGFPTCDFEQPSAAEDLIGPYSLSTTFYDAEYHAVTTAETPGRYGAVTEIKTEDGKRFRRFCTLFRTLRAVDWWRPGGTGSFEFPSEMGIDPIVAGQQKQSMGSYLGALVGDGLTRHSETAALLAALYETRPGAPDAGVFDDFRARDRQWWVGLKRKLTGADKLYPNPVVCPQIVKDKPAPVLHEGTLQEAGMKPGAAENIDALLKKWSADSDEPFAVCIARHGVIILYRAYGRRDGQAMTVDTQSDMASITKPIAATAMMMLVDQGLVNLDDPVTKFLPSFRGPAVPTALTIRHLYTHTSGLEGHWGDDLNDFDDVIAGYYPYMSIGKRHEYNGAGPALGSKIVEYISGEALPQFYRHHLLDPLGCVHTDVTNSSYDARSTPMDIAKFGQMLLNRGSYGDKRFMSPQTFEQMLPQRLTKLLGPDTNIEWGIGLIWFKDEGLGKGTFVLIGDPARRSRARPGDRHVPQRPGRELHRVPREVPGRDHREPGGVIGKTVPFMVSAPQ